MTQCGHLYCWPCLYRWLEAGMLPQERQNLQGLMTTFASTQVVVDETRRVCPVCKAPCAVSTIVPIYTSSTAAASSTVTGEGPVNANTASNTAVAMTDETPPASPPTLPHDDTPLVANGLRQRSVPARPAATTPQRTSRNNSRSRSSSSSSSSSSITPRSPPPRASLGLALQQQVISHELPPASEFLSRILLILGSFVILCLLLF